MGKKTSTSIFLLACASLGLLTASPALAESPMDISGGTRIEDTTGTLTNTSELQSKINQLAQEHSLNLYVVIIDSFENPSDSTEWVETLASLNNMGTNDLVLAIATEDRAARFTAAASGKLTQSQTDSIYTDYIYPELRNLDYEGAALAAVQGIDSELSGSALSGPLLGLATLGGVAAVAGGGAWLMTRSRRNRGTKSSTPASGQEPLVRLEQLRTEAGQLLVSTDDAVAHSLQEVEFARLQYGEKEVAPFLAAIEQAKAHMQRSFQLQKQLDDDIPDTEEDQRSWLTEIINRCKDAQKSLAEQEKNFTDLRQLEQNAPRVLETLISHQQALSSYFEKAELSLARMRETYASSAYESVADNLEQARGREEFAAESISSAQSLLGTNRSEAILEIRAGEEAVGQAKGLLESVSHTEEELAKAREALSSALLLAQRDVAQARELAKYEATSQLSGAAAGVEAVLAQIQSESQQVKNDPLALSRRLQEARSELDTALGTVRKSQEQEQSARDALKHTLVSAQAQVSSASEYVWARRGGVRAEARTKLREAERHLEEAQQLQKTDAITALSHANDAIRLASQAQEIARQDVDDFNNYSGGYGRGRSDNSALLGGILLGTLLGGGNHGGSFGGGHFGSGGGFGGGFGGGGLGSGGGFGGGPSSGGTF